MTKNPIEEFIQKEVEKQLTNRAIASKSWTKAEITQDTNWLYNRTGVQDKQIRKLFAMIRNLQKEYDPHKAPDNPTSPGIEEEIINPVNKYDCSNNPPWFRPERVSFERAVQSFIRDCAKKGNRAEQDIAKQLSYIVSNWTL